MKFSHRGGPEALTTTRGVELGRAKPGDKIWQRKGKTDHKVWLYQTTSDTINTSGRRRITPDITSALFWCLQTVHSPMCLSGILYGMFTSLFLYKLGLKYHSFIM